MALVFPRPRGSLLDFLAGPIVFFPLLFVIPVALMAWNSGLRTAMTLGAILCVFRFTVQYATDIPYALPVALINAIVRLSLLFFITFLCGKLSAIQALRARIRTLEGFLPTCSICKDIRDEDGKWHQIEDYVAHGRQPVSATECARNAWPITTATW